MCVVADTDNSCFAQPGTSPAGLQAAVKITCISILSCPALHLEPPSSGLHADRLAKISAASANRTLFSPYFIPCLTPASHARSLSPALFHLPLSSSPISHLPELAVDILTSSQALYSLSLSPPPPHLLLHTAALRPYLYLPTNDSRTPVHPHPSTLTLTHTDVHIPAQLAPYLYTCNRSA